LRPEHSPFDDRHHPLLGAAGAARAMSGAHGAVGDPRAIDGGIGSRYWIVLMVALVACVWFGTLDARHLRPTDEGRYAEIAREMFVSGDWVTIRYNDLKYFEKPPFHLWVTALVYHAFGVGEWQARLWVGVSGALGMLLTMLAARRWYGPGVGLLSGLVLLAAPNWNFGAHFNSLDMGLSGALAAVLAGALIAQHPQTGAAARRRWMWFAWGAIGVAVLTKGLIGIVVPGLALVVYSLWARDLQIWRRLHIASGVLLMLAITVPWFWLVARRNPEFLHFFFVHEHFQRYLSKVHQRSAPIWYFVPQLLGGFAPWLGLWPGIVARIRDPAPGEGLRPALLLAAWASSIFVFFSLSSSKLPGYILPMMPALAVLAALALDRLSARAWSRQLTGALVVCVGLVLASPWVTRLGSATTPNALYRDYAPWLVAASLTALLGVLLARRLLARGRQRGSIAAYALAMFAAATVALVGHDTLGRSDSGVDLVAPIRAVLGPEMPIYGVRMLDHTLPFYLGRTLIIVEAPDELEFGTQQEPRKWLPTMAAFRDRWLAGPHALAVMSHGTFESLRREGLPMVTIAEDPRRVVVANFEARRP
jgi:4-amino-4-deoxy-L-arabinose transferase-like glycosyltransferase